MKPTRRESALKQIQSMSCGEEIPQLPIKCFETQQPAEFASIYAIWAGSLYQVAINPGHLQFKQLHEKIAAFIKASDKFKHRLCLINLLTQELVNSDLFITPNSSLYLMVFAKPLPAQSDTPHNKPQFSQAGILPFKPEIKQGLGHEIERKLQQFKAECLADIERKCQSLYFKGYEAEAHPKACELSKPICPFLPCLRSFSSVRVLRHHIFKIHLPDSLKCLSCQASFSNKYYFRQHTSLAQSGTPVWQKCSQETPSQCRARTHCHPFFSNSRATHSLKRHPSQRDSNSLNPEIRELARRVSEEEPKRDGQQPEEKKIETDGPRRTKKDYICPFCKREFKKKFSLEDHLFSHSNSKSYTCEICGKNFKRERTLKVHQKNLHSQLLERYPQLKMGKHYPNPHLFQENEQAIPFPQSTTVQPLNIVSGAQIPPPLEQFSPVRATSPGQGILNTVGLLSNSALGGGLNELAAGLPSNELLTQISSAITPPRFLVQLELLKRYLELEKLKKQCLFQQYLINQKDKDNRGT